MHGDLGIVNRTDVVIAISYSGETAELNSLLGNLKRRSASLIAMTGVVDSTLGQGADVFLISPCRGKPARWGWRQRPVRPPPWRLAMRWRWY
ncbi:MAG: SIS domain-containing protein [Desulfofustis sp.]